MIVKSFDWKDVWLYRVLVGYAVKIMKYAEEKYENPTWEHKPLFGHLDGCAKIDMKYTEEKWNPTWEHKALSPSPPWQKLSSRP